MQRSADIDKTWFGRSLRFIEKTGNALPQPAVLFALLAAIVLAISAVAAGWGLEVVHPSTGKTLQAVNLLSLEGLHRIIAGTLTNFIQFPPLAVTLVCLLGIAVAEHTGLIGATVRLLVLGAPKRWMTALVVFAGVMSNAGGDVGYVLLIPLSAAVFHAMGRHPLAGLAAAFSGVSGGFSANLLVGTIDVLLAGITQSAAALVAPQYTVTALANYYFMAAATVLITFVGAWVTERIVEPRLGLYQGAAQATPLEPLSAAERRGLVWAGAFAVLFTGVLLVGLVPTDGFLRDPLHPESVLRSLLFSHMVPFILVAGVGLGLAYGLGAKTVKSDRDVVKGMETALSSMGSYLVLAFFASQFIAYFNWSNLGLIVAVKGAALIKDAGLHDWPIPLMVSVVIFSSTLNLFIGSASAKWALLAPVFVPMFMLLGYSPEMVQAAYRVGDSCSNIITPLMSYFPLILSFVHRYDPRAGIGTMISTMLPYTIAYLISWTLLLVAWIALDAPIGVGAGLHYSAH